MVCVNYISCGVLESTKLWNDPHMTWKPLNSIYRRMNTHKLCIWFCQLWQIQFWSASSFLPGDCNAVCNWWWMYLKWNCTPCSSFVITVLYYCHVSRGHDGIRFLSTLINFNLLVFWTVQLQPSNIIIHYCATFMNWFSCHTAHNRCHVSLMSSAIGNTLD